MSRQSRSPRARVAAGRRTVLLGFLAASGCARYGPVVPGSQPVVRPAGMPAEGIATPAGRSFSARHVLLMPVTGVAPRDLADSFHATRAGGRIHRATDIFAAEGTVVVSASPARVIHVGENRLGGLVVYTADSSSALVFYYAHLSAVVPGLRVGQWLEAGAPIGAVGRTGNAAGTPAHLHFQVMRMTAGRPYWDGDPIDPLPLLGR